MKTRSLQHWLFALGCALALAFAVPGPASAQHHYYGGGGWHGGWSYGWHGGGYGRGWGWGGVYIAPRPYNYCSYGYCYAQPPYYPYYPYLPPPPAYYGY